MKSHCVGIDLGTTFCSVSFWDSEGMRAEVVEHDVTGMLSIPSWVGFGDAEVFVGQAAKDQAVFNPTNTIFDAKRIIGLDWTDRQFVLERKSCKWPFEVVAPDSTRTRPRYDVTSFGVKKLISPEEVSMRLLSELKRIAELKLGSVTQAVITVPANFNKSQIQATITAGELAGLEILGTIPEPTAAALYYGFVTRNETDNERLLVFDFGGGTLDVTVLKRINSDFTVLSTTGNMHLGGEDIDNAIIDFCLEDIRNSHREDVSKNNVHMWKLRLACEKAKKDLSNQEQVELRAAGLIRGEDYVKRISRAVLERILDPILRQLEQPVHDALAGAKRKDSSFLSPSKVLFVGGSSKIPAVRRRIQDLLGITGTTNLPVDTIVSQGAALRAHMLKHISKNGTSIVPGLPAEFQPVLFDVTPLHTGILVDSGRVSVVIPPQTTIPCAASRIYTTALDMQEAVNICVYEGQTEFAHENVLVGEFRIEGIPARPRGTVKIPVTFQLDQNGLLSVTATVEGTRLKGACKVKVFDNSITKREMSAITQNVKNETRQTSYLKEDLSNLRERVKNTCIAVEEYIGRKLPDSKEVIDIAHTDGVTVKAVNERLDQLIYTAHQRSFPDLISAYLRNCRKMLQNESDDGRRSTLKKCQESLSKIDQNDPSFYFEAHSSIIQLRKLRPTQKPKIYFAPVAKTGELTFDPGFVRETE